MTIDGRKKADGCGRSLRRLSVCQAAVFFFMSLCLHLPAMAVYYGQYGQDQYVNETYFHNMKDGTFVEIGAFDGITANNTYFFEKELRWQGICVEPNPEVFDRLRQNRKCLCVQGCVSDKSGEAKYLYLSQAAVLGGLIEKYDPRDVENLNRELQEAGGYSKEISVQCYTFNDLMKRNGISHVNFLSLDTEGGEYDILATIDYSKIIIDVIAVEDVYHDPRFLMLMESKGFSLVEKKTCDLLFVRHDFLARVPPGAVSNR